MHKLVLYLLAVILILTGCQNVEEEGINGDRDLGIARETLDLIYYGPKGCQLEYFSRKMIYLSRINYCEIIESRDSQTSVVRKVTFDSRGNIIKDENNFFSDITLGTVRGNYQFVFDQSNNLLQSKGTPAEDSNDSIMAISNYNKKGLLLSREQFEFKKKLKPGADEHLPGPNDFEKKPSWNKIETTQFFSSSDSTIIRKFVQGKCVSREKYILAFDSIGQLKTIKNFSGDSLHETTVYLYDWNSITEILTRKMNNGKEWVYKSKAIIDSNKNQTEKIIFEHDGIGEAKIITKYNKNGTINEVRSGDVVKTFKYTYY